MISIKYKNLETGCIISDPDFFADQFLKKRCVDLKLEIVESLIDIISCYVKQEISQIRHSIVSYSNYHKKIVGQQYSNEDIQRGVKIFLVNRLNDIYEYSSIEDVSTTILDRDLTILRDLKIIEDEMEGGKEIWVERELINEYLSPLLHFLGIKKCDNINYFVPANTFPKNYQLRNIYPIFKEMFSNIREATIRNLYPTRIEDFTDEQRANRAFKSVIIKALNKGIRMNLSSDSDCSTREVKVRFSTTNLETYIGSDDKKNVRNSSKRVLPNETIEENNNKKKKFIKTLLEERRVEKPYLSR